MEPPNTSQLESTIRHGVRAAWKSFTSRVPDPHQRELALSDMACKIEEAIDGEINDLVALSLFHMLAFLCEQNVLEEKPQ